MAKDPKAIAILLGKAKPAAAGPAEPDGDEMGGEMAAANGILQAMKDGDAGALAAELRNFVELCTSKYEE